MQLHQQRGPPTPGTANLSTRALMNVDGARSNMSLSMPPTPLVLLHSALHILILALSAFSLVALWQRAPRWAFILLLVWTVVFYAIIVVLSWHGRPKDSTLTVLLSRLRGQQENPYESAATPSQSRPLSPADPQGPYMHQPLSHIAPEDGYISPVRHEHAASEEPDSDEDEDTRQRRIEDEMARRDVSIVTVPKRKLWITNPS